MTGDFTFKFFLLRLSRSRNFHFRLSESFSEITSCFDLHASLILDRTVAQRKAEQKAKSKSEVTRCCG